MERESAPDIRSHTSKTFTPIVTYVDLNFECSVRSPCRQGFLQVCDRTPGALDEQRTMGMKRVNTSAGFLQVWSLSTSFRIISACEMSCIAFVPSSYPNDVSKSIRSSITLPSSLSLAQMR